jgi:hypothetical protein
MHAPIRLSNHTVFVCEHACMILSACVCAHKSPGQAKHDLCCLYIHEYINTPKHVQSSSCPTSPIHLAGSSSSGAKISRSNLPNPASTSATQNHNTWSRYMNDVNTQGNRRSMNERMMASMQPDPSQPKSAFSPFPALDQTTSRAYIHNLDRTTRRSPPLVSLGGPHGVRNTGEQPSFQGNSARPSSQSASHHQYGSSGSSRDITSDSVKKSSGVGSKKKLMALVLRPPRPSKRKKSPSAAIVNSCKDEWLECSACGSWRHFHSTVYDLADRAKSGKWTCPDGGKMCGQLDEIETFMVNWISMISDDDGTAVYRFKLENREFSVHDLYWAVESFGGVDHVTKWKDVANEMLSRKGAPGTGPAPGKNFGLLRNQWERWQLSKYHDLFGHVPIPAAYDRPSLQHLVKSRHAHNTSKQDGVGQHKRGSPTGLTTPDSVGTLRDAWTSAKRRKSDYSGSVLSPRSIDEGRDEDATQLASEEGDDDDSDGLESGDGDHDMRYEHQTDEMKYAKIRERELWLKQKEKELRLKDQILSRKEQLLRPGGVAKSHGRSQDVPREQATTASRRGPYSSDYMNFDQDDDEMEKRLDDAYAHLDCSRTVR